LAEAALLESHSEREEHSLQHDSGEKSPDKTSTSAAERDAKHPNTKKYPSSLASKSGSWKLRKTALQMLPAYVSVSDLLRARKNVLNLRDSDGRTPLFVASALGNKDVVRVLLAYGADVSVEANNGLTSLAVAKDRGVRQLQEEALVRWLGKTSRVGRHFGRDSRQASNSSRPLCDSESGANSESPYGWTSALGSAHSDSHSHSSHSR